METLLNHFYSSEHPSLSSLHKDESFSFDISQIFGAFLQNGSVFISVFFFFFKSQFLYYLKILFPHCHPSPNDKISLWNMIIGQCCQLLSDYKLLTWALLFISLGYDSGSMRRVTGKRE